MFWMRAYTLRGEVGGGWVLKFSSFLGPVKWERADRRVPFGAQVHENSNFFLYGWHFGLPESDQQCSGSGCGSFHQHTKKLRKTLI
jgi:hypothetical protein